MCLSVSFFAVVLQLFSSLKSQCRQSLETAHEDILHHYLEETRPRANPPDNYRDQWYVSRYGLCSAAKHAKHAKHGKAQPSSLDQTRISGCTSTLKSYCCSITQKSKRITKACQLDAQKSHVKHVWQAVLAEILHVLWKVFQYLDDRFTQDII